MIEKAIRIADVFLNNYPIDGGCDEGPNYWNVADGRLIDFIDLLSSASNGSMNWSKNELIHNIGSYSYKVYIGDGRFVNFADASAVWGLDPLKVIKYGMYFNDEKLKRFGSHLNQQYNDKSSGITLFNALGAKSLMKTTSSNPPLEAESWLSNLQILTIRAKEGSTDGFFLGAKAGHNGNDIN